MSKMNCWAASIFSCVLWVAIPCGVTIGAAAQESGDIERGFSQFTACEFASAKKLFQTHLESHPKDAQTMLYLGWIALEQREVETAVRWFQRATRIAPTNSLYFHWLGRSYGLQAREAGIPGGAIACFKAKAAFERALEFDPNNFEARYDLLQWYLETPVIAGGGTQLARAEAEQIKKRDPYLGNVAAGRVFEDEKSFASAERAYQAAKELNPEKLEAHYALGFLYQRTHQYEKALAAFEKILTLTPKVASPYQLGTTEAHYQIGKTCLLFGQRLDRAEEALRIYLKTKPRFFMPSLASAHFRLGSLYAKNGNRTRARSEYEAALAIEPGHEDAKAALEKLR